MTQRVKGSEMAAMASQRLLLAAAVARGEDLLGSRERRRQSGGERACAKGCEVWPAAATEGLELA